MRKIYRYLVWLFVSVIYLWGCFCYKKKYLRGKYFDRWHFSEGWIWILKYWFGQKIMRKNGDVPWPIPPHVKVAAPQNIIFDPDDMQNFHMTGNYFQALNAKLIIGSGSLIAPGVGLVTANHNPDDINSHLDGKDIILGEKCWIGMNSVILPGVVLGDHTVVGAGSVVTKSFPEGNCIIAGNPARVIRSLAKETAE